MRGGSTLVFLIILTVAGIMVLAATEPWVLYEGRDRLGRFLAPYFPTFRQRRPFRLDGLSEG
ncbi:MAG TPA: hypothetical protein PLG99_07690, partial [Kaistiaceae bacterium]|nr:hypothetical protein [Kaistiaceae bacterium]